MDEGTAVGTSRHGGTMDATREKKRPSPVGERLRPPARLTAGSELAYLQQRTAVSSAFLVLSMLRYNTLLETRRVQRTTSTLPPRARAARCALS